MGIAIANELNSCKADVTLICGPVAEQYLQPGIRLIRIQTAREMNEQCMNLFPHADGAILSAAVADFRPVTPTLEKTKRKSGNLNVELETTEDIAENLGKIKTTKQFLAGFALETSNEIDNAREKLQKKNFDLIVLNSLKDAGAGFNVDTNKITIIDKHNKITRFKLKTKKEVAYDIVSYLAQFLS